MQNKNKLIELWKTNCVHCEVVRLIVTDLEKDGIIFEKYNIEDKEGFTLMNDYSEEIEHNNERLGYNAGFIYAPTFINPTNRNVMSFEDRAPTKEELIELVKGGAII